MPKTIENKCVVCGCGFRSSRGDARTCSSKCRTALSRGTASGQGRGAYAVRKGYQERYESLMARGVNDETVEALNAVLVNFGASAFEWAFVAVEAMVKSFDDGTWGI